MSFPVLFVCIGNVCRSPFAERLLRTRLDALGIGDRFEVSSAGVRAMAGRPMHPESARTLVERGGSPDGFTARQFQSGLVDATVADTGGLVLAATRDIRSRLLEEAPRALRRTFTLLEFVALAEAHRAAGDVQPGRRTHAPVVSDDQRLRRLVEECAEGRGALRLEEYDIADPIGRSPETYDGVATLMADQIDRLAAILVDPV
ncbi:low molecular weight phosphatase family protein [Nocardioides sp. Root151]|uniref:arsenate reductase/protein-tyrosine-phosphatase family protein n=1 Tax=Nocardioides sp. Root151 TaxID=1736475 RepID=UPI000702AA97|nr:low molecular weight phosphatase family protein [Nocardioides sp. Root151]KQZ75769.1 hypothetical protein ASD66_05425 [Nocardioides sp. Root151]